MQHYHLTNMCIPPGQSYLYNGNLLWIVVCAWNRRYWVHGWIQRKRGSHGT